MRIAIASDHAGFQLKTLLLTRLSVEPDVSFVDLGTYAQAGQQVFYLVTRDVWVVANFKETQLDRMRVGQLVDVKVDAYSQLHLSGHIESIQGGSGARFTAFPAENATGNFVKIVRRVPVKIIIDHGLEQWPFLPLGLSVEPTVYF